MDTLSLNIPITTELIFGRRIVLAGVCGMLIGIERTRRLKEAGIRTHAMVACHGMPAHDTFKIRFFRPR